MSYLDEKSPVALYYQLKEEILKKILAKQWKVGEKIPNEYELCEQYHVSRITVRQALSELEKDGYVVRKQGKGTYVSTPNIEQNLTGFYSFSEEFKKKGFIPSTKVIEFGIRKVEKDISVKLRLPDNSETVYHIKRLRYADDILMAIESSYLPVEIFPDMKKEDLERAPMYEIMRERYGIFPDSAEESFGVSLIGEKEAGYFNIGRGSAAFDVERFTFSGQKCIEFTKGIVRGDIFRFHARLTSL